MQHQLTIEIVDDSKIGKKGYPMHYQALGISPPMKTVPLLDDGSPDYSHPGLTPEEIADAQSHL